MLARQLALHANDLLFLHAVHNQLSSFVKYFETRVTDVYLAAPTGQEARCSQTDQTFLMLLAAS